ncbi:MAG TPA: gliding motility-associated C-terminal domain-containing protein [Cytophagales bacterium]|nr:gliding motility-associated C-terminal domain-containing protein [Cytophagales bacterium]
MRKQDNYIYIGSYFQGYLLSQLKATLPFLKFSLKVILFLFLLLNSSKTLSQDCNCDHTITLDQEIIDGSKLGISPGDTICIQAGKREYLWFQNFEGTQDKPLVFINCGGQVTISNTTKWGISFSYSKYFKILGSGDPNFKYGIKIDGVATVGLGFNRLTTDFEAGYIEVTKSLGVGCNAKTDPECDKPETWRGNFVMRNVDIHHFYIHDVGTKAGGGEGFYLGHSFFMGIKTTCGTLFPHDIENIKVHDNIIENTAFDGMQLSCAISGAEVYNNSIKNYGILNNGSQQTGMVIGGGSKGKYYNNTIEKGTGAGITVFGQGDVYVYNNVISNSEQDGIFIDDRTTTAGLGFHLYNNTVIDAKLNGITMYSAQSKGNTFYNNLIVNPGNQTVFVTNPKKAFIYLENMPGKVVDFDSANNFFSKDVASVKFADPANLDFHLQKTSPVIDKGKDLSSQGVTFDLDYFKRSYGKAFDPGAYEFGASVSVPQLKIKVVTTSIKCNGGNDGAASITAIGGIEPYSYIWSTGAVTPTVSGLKAGSYSVKVIDDIGNHTTENITITEPSALSITFSKVNESETAKGSINITAQGGLAPYTYKWSNNETTEDLNNLSEGSYTVTVTDQNKCSVTQTIALKKYSEVTVDPLPKASAGNDTTIYSIKNEVTLTGTSNIANEKLSEIYWEQINGPALDLTDTDDEVITLSNLLEGTYTFRFTVIDINNNIASDEVEVMVITPVENSLAIIPAKFFSPNGDNSGDEMWHIENVEKISDCQLVIFSQNGAKVYETNHYVNNWDGRFNGRDLPEGAYFYVINCTGTGQSQTGSIRLLR